MTQSSLSGKVTSLNRRSNLEVKEKPYFESANHHVIDEKVACTSGLVLHSQRSVAPGQLEKAPETDDPLEQIVNYLREAEIFVSQGQSVRKVSRKIGITEQTYYRWRKEYGGLRMDRAKRLKEFEKENSRLKKLLAEQSLDNAILKEAASGNF